MSYWEQRLAKARTYLKGLDAILLSSRFNVTYVTGYTGSDAVTLLTDTTADLFVDSRNTLQAREEAHANVYEIRKRWEEIYEHLKGLNIKTLGIESNVIDLDSFLQMKNIFSGIEMNPMGGQLKYLRAIKDPDEAALIGEAARIAGTALCEVLAEGIIGRREIEVAFELECAMRRLGASGPSFETIVASGPRSAMPHGTASEKVIGPGEAVVFDYGSMYKGYASDETITVFTGEPDREFCEVYHHVRKAQALAIEALSSGVKASSIDRIARDHLESAGLGRYFGHGLGHGVGMEVHEMPTVSYISNDTLEKGMVITVEPGVYLAGKFGVRTEDTLLITDNSCKRLTNLDKDSIKVTT
jgi:Xaa-Pro aminopeptidase